MKNIFIKSTLIFILFNCCFNANAQSYNWVSLQDSVTPFGLMINVGSLACDGSNNLFATTANPIFGYSVVKYSKNSWRDTHIGGADNSNISTFRKDTLGEVYNIITKGFWSSGYIYGFRDSAITFYDTAYSSQIYPNGFDNFKVGKNGNVYTQSYLNNVDGIFKWNRLTNAWNRLKGTGADTLIKNLYTYRLFATSKNSNPVVINSTGNLIQWNGTGWIAIGTKGGLLNNLHNINDIVADKNGDWYAYGKLQSSNTNFRAFWNESTRAWVQLVYNSANPYSDTCIDIKSITNDGKGNYYGISKCVNTSNQQFVAKWNGTQWSELGNLNANNIISALTIDTAGNVYTAGSFTNNIGRIYVAKYQIITPINLSNFSSKTVQNKVELNWQTLTETDNKYFEIERSIDAKKFVSISKILSKKTNNTNNYNFIDEKPNYLNHYRLKQVDNDGKFTYSKILFVKMPTANPLVIGINPVKDFVQIKISLEDNKLKEILLFDLYGKKIKTYKAKQGSQQINIQGLAAGKYLLCLQTTNGEIYKQQIVVLN